ncbi:MAG: 30S ribosomal protein S9 [Actinomycetota bacterium]|nr:30S ribosomal protein S9 [Actinomycetota bacterium]
MSTPESTQDEAVTPVDAVTEVPAAAEETVADPPVVADVPVAADVPPAERAAPAVLGSRVAPILDRLVQTVGRRKQAIVRVRLVAGTGVFTLNGKTLEKYFPNKVHQQLVRDPLVTVERTESYDVIGTLAGGGTSGQAGALRLAVARALIEIDPDDRPALKKAGFLTRDPRAKERKKYGLKKARKAPQYSKR